MITKADSVLSATVFGLSAFKSADAVWKSLSHHFNLKIQISSVVNCFATRRNVHLPSLLKEAYMRVKCLLWWNLESINAYYKLKTFLNQYFHKLQYYLFHRILSFRWKQTNYGSTLAFERKVLCQLLSNMSNNSSLVVTPTTLSQVAPTLAYDEVEIIASAVVYVLLALLVILGNILVIVAFKFNPRLQTTNNTFLVGLAVSDLLVGLISIPLWIYFSTCQQYSTCVSSTKLLTFYSTVDIFTGCASVLQLTAISIERYLAITRPINHRSYSMWIYYSMIAAAWGFAFIMAGLYPVQLHRWQKLYSIILATTCFAIPTLVIWTVYAIIFKTARGAARARVYPAEVAKRPVQNDTKIAATIALITGLFVIAWLPFFVVNMLAEFCLSCLPAYPSILRLVRFVKWMHYSNSMLNPLVYAYRNGDMRKTFKRLLLSCFCCCCCGHNDSRFRISVRTGRSRRFEGAEHSPGNKELHNDSDKSARRSMPARKSVKNAENGVNAKENS